jgi:amidase
MTTTVALDYATSTVGELRDALTRREVGARELTETAIGEIEARDEPINAVVVRDFERARRAADAADAALAAGARAPLLGVPLTVKESYDLAGFPTTWGFEPFGGHVASEDALAVQRLKAAGAIILGKTNVPVMLADWQSSNPIYGRTNNPLDLRRTPGGSSGGSAAALAAGFVPLELGSDIGGSIRVPAAFCGVYGHKPSWGLVPNRGQSPGGMGGAEPPLAVAGPLARSAADLRTALQVIAGPDPSLGRAPGAPLTPPRAERLSDLRALVIDAHPLTHATREVRAGVNALADRLSDAGSRVQRGADLVPDLAKAHETYVRMLNTVISRGQPDARPISAHDWLAAIDEQQKAREQWATLFGDWDVVLAPSFGTSAFPHVDEADWSLRTLDVDGEAAPYGGQLAWAGMATFANLPATGMPAPRSGPLPVGVQIIGPYLEDLTTIRVAELLSAA